MIARPDTAPPFGTLMKPQLIAAAELDRLETWQKYSAHMCGGCVSSCCTLPVEVKIKDLIRIGIVDEKGGKEAGVRYRAALQGVTVGTVTAPGTRPGAKEPVDKLYAIIKFEPWDWIIGFGDYVDDIENTFWRNTAILLSIGAVLMLVIAAGYDQIVSTQAIDECAKCDKVVGGSDRSTSMSSSARPRAFSSRATWRLMAEGAMPSRSAA